MRCLELVSFDYHCYRIENISETKKQRDIERRDYFDKILISSLMSMHLMKLVIK